jgi:hypothetical protein
VSKHEMRIIRLWRRTILLLALLGTVLALELKWLEVVRFAALYVLMVAVQFGIVWLIMPALAKKINGGKK